MKPPHQHSRVNLDELKAQLVKNLGPEGSKQYFYYLHGFLSLKLSKPEFNKLCLKILGRENIPLHNHFIRSILRNACSAKAPPPANHHKDDNGLSKQVIHGKEISSNGYQKNGSHISTTQASSGFPGLPNGGDMVLLPVSPRKARTTGLRDRRGGERRSSLGPNGKVAPAPPQPPDASARLDGINIVLENGYSKLNPPDSNTDITKPPLVQDYQVLLQQAKSENASPTTVYNKDQAEMVTSNDEKRDASAARRRSPIRAPLGVPLCSASAGGAREAVSRGHMLVGAFCDGALVDSRALRERMENIASGQGLEGVSVDCANVLNNGLDIYLKGLIKSCIDIVGTRSGLQLTKVSSPSKDQAHIKLPNGVHPGHQHQLQNREQKIVCPISLQDFRVAMELNPRQLGEDWPLLLEKICTHAFEE